MKNNSLSAALIVLCLCFFGSLNASAQTGIPYNNGIGLFLDLGNGGTYVGPHVKHFFNERDAGQVMVLFGNSTTVIGAEYSYNKAIPNAGGLMWNIGVGPQVYFVNDYTGFLIRPQAGLEFKVPQAPISIGFDWRPMWELTNGSSFEAGRFGLSFKYAF